jgi:glyoxylase I family protein
MLLSRIHHAAIICSDYARSKRFYCEVLGLRVVAEAFREARGSYKLDLALPDGTQLELFSFPNPPPQARRTRRPAACATWRSKCRTSARLAAALQAQGIAVERIRVELNVDGAAVLRSFAGPGSAIPWNLYQARVLAARRAIHWANRREKPCERAHSSIPSQLEP